ncbi:MAG: prepilin-type N-terminal cleavage/methylation domain-containing protein [Gammaproteobacteria bacterium]|nr:prepilin-type N-terminal cleavage/methylation domain-containing protein [Gammaproteobacteria bacterium]
MVRSQRGFSLLEVLVAFSLTALSLGVVFEIYAKGATATILAGEYTQALAVAESKLAGVPVDNALHHFGEQGREHDKYDWELTVEDYAVDGWNAGLPPSWSLVSVNVDVSWQSRGKLRQVSLQTLKPRVAP